MTIGAQFATRNEVEVLRRKIERAISGAAIAQHIIDPGAVDAFTDLTDVPQDYAGAGNFVVRVAGAEDELEFVELMLADLADVYFPSGEPDIGDVLTYESGGWTSMPPGAGGALDDLSDVNAPAPVDQYVLTWDDSAGEWIAQAVPFIDHYLDDHPDVYFPSGEPDIGDVLTYESGGWTSMPGGGALALDDLTDVDATAPNDNDIIRYDTGSGLWQHEPLPAGGGTHSLWFADAFPGSPTAESDHFDDASLDAKWNEFDIPGTIVITEANHHVKFAITSLLNNHVGMWQTLPSGNFTITAKIRTEYGRGLEAKYMYWGITLFQDATNNPSTSDILIFHVYQYNNTVTPQVLHFSSYNTYAGAPYSGPPLLAAPFQAIYFRVRRNGTNFYYDLSLDNLSWKQYAGPIAQGSYFTPAEFGITCYQESGAEQYVYCDWIYYQASDNFAAAAIGASISI